MNPFTQQTKSDASNTAAADRGVSEVLGAVLIFGVLLLLLALVQVHFIPVANQQVEYEHNQRIQSDMLDFAHQLERTATVGQAGSTALELTAHYPARLIFLNPPPAAGSFESAITGEMRISNAVASSATKHWNGSDQRYTTTTYRYRSAYNLYDEAPNTVYEHSTLVNVFPSDVTLPLDSSSLISGDTISLVTMEGNLSRSSSTPYSIQTAVLSGPTKTMSIESAGNEPLILRLPTTLSTESWRTTLDDELGPDGRIHQLEVINGVLTIELAPGTYDLRMARVGLGPASNRPRVSAHYIATSKSEYGSIRSDETQQVQVEIRDTHNNPVGGSVTFSTEDGAFLVSGETATQSVTVDADSNGIASTVFRPSTGFEGTAEIRVEGDLDKDTVIEDIESRTLNVSVSPALSEEEVNEGLSTINPAGDVRVVSVNSIGSSTVEVTLENTVDQDRTMEQARFSFYYANENAAGADTLTITDPAGDTTFDIYDNFQFLNQQITIPGGEQRTVTIQFDKNQVGQDIFGWSVIYNQGRATYFVPVPP